MRNDICKTVEIKNSGFSYVSLERVLVNNGEDPIKVELGISKTQHLILGGGLDKYPYVTFHNIRKYKINPQLSVVKRQELAEKKDRKIIKHYGLRVYNEKPLEKIIIVYRYLGIQFQQEIDVKSI